MTIDNPFPSLFEFRILTEIGSGDTRRMFFPGAVKSGGHDGINVRIVPHEGEAWVGTFASGRFGNKAITGVFATPNPSKLCVVAGGQAYVVDVTNPKAHEEISLVPIIAVRSSEKYRLLIFANHTELLAIGDNGIAWRTERLSWDGLKLTAMDDENIRGVFWDIQSESERSFIVNLADGTHVGGAFVPS